MNIRFSFSQCLRHAFFSGAGYGDLEKISDEDQDRWVAFEPPEVGSFAKMEQHFQALETDPWSTDLEAAPLDRDVLVFCEDTKEYFVAYRYSEKLKGAFCFGNHKGAFLICMPTKWREIPV